MDEEFEPCAVGRRIRTVRERTGLTQNAWGRQLGMTAQQVVNYENGRVPDPLFLLRIARHADVSVDWILTGDAASRKPGSPKRSPVLVSRALKPTFPGVDASAVVAIPVLRTEAMSGEPRGIEPSDIADWIWMPRAAIRERERHSLVAITMAGNSMQPMIFPGSLVVIDMDDRRVSRSGIYAIAPSRSVWTIKFLRRVSDTLALVPANAETDETYPASIDPRRNEHAIVGRAVWCSRFLA